MTALDDARSAALAALGVDPAAGRELVVGPWEVDGDTVLLPHDLAGVTRFVERVRFAGPDGAPMDLGAAASDPVLAAALDLLALATAPSYAKVTLPPAVRVPPAHPAARAMLTGLLTAGLAELAHDHGLGPLDDRVMVTGPDRPAAAPAPRRAGTLVTVGGGKDSAVVARVARREDPDAWAFTVNPRDPMRRTAELVGLPLATAHRTLDPALLALNARGAINGHVPITAIVTACALVAAAASGRGTVVLANEASADEPTRVVDGWRVNHQWSKSSAFERLLAAALEASTGGALGVVSVLRPVPELLVARAAARVPGLLAATTSCNAAFAISAPREGWCGACPKCRFVELALAPFVPRARLVADLGFDALDDPAQLDAYRDLLDPARRPFECVGTIEETRLALDLAAATTDWRDATAVRALGDADAAPGARLAALADGVDVSGLPAPHDRWAAAIVRGDLA